MFLSIIIPVHNTEKYIRDCLDSCLSQDIDKSDYEIICVDDGSTDNSVEILRGYEERETNIHVVLLPENKGVSAARNAGIERIQGEYCMFLDSDDYLEDNCFLRLKQMLPEADKKTILCVGRFHFVEKGHANRNENRKEGSYFGCPTQRYITNRLMPSKLVSQLRFQENIAYGEDEVFCLELEQFEPTILKLDEPIYYYRKHAESAMALTSEKKAKRCDSVINSAVYMGNKYGYNSPRIQCFIRERIYVVFKYLDSVSFYEKWLILKKMKRYGMPYISDDDNTNSDIVAAYVIHRSRPVRIFLAKHFPYMTKIKKRVKDLKNKRFCG